MGDPPQRLPEAIAMGAALPATPDQAPEPTPAPAEQTPAPAPSATPESTPSPTPTEQPPAAAKEPDPHVPWAKFREVQTQFTQTRRQAAAEAQRYQQQLQELQKQYDDHKRFKDDFSVLERLLNDNPDLADQLYQRATKGGGAATHNAPAQAPHEVQALLRDMQEVKAILADARQQQVQQRTAHEDELTKQQLDGVLIKCLKDRNMNEAFLDQARSYVLARVAKEMPDLSLEEVPYVFSDWYKPLHQALNQQVESMRSGKQADQRLPVSPGAAPPVSQRTSPGALDATTAQTLEEMLSQRLGWKNGA